MKSLDSATRVDQFRKLTDEDKIEYTLPNLGEYIVTRTDGPKKKLHGTVKYESAKAILFVLSEDKHEGEVDTDVSPDAFTKGIWFPFSQVKEIHKKTPLNSQEFDEIVVSGWIAGKNGIEL